MQVKTKKITLSELAKLCGLSNTAVSSILNNYQNYKVPEKTRQKVFDMAAQHGYLRNELARAVITGRSRVLAFVADGETNWEYVSRVLDGALHMVAAHDYSLKVLAIAYFKECFPDQYQRRIVEKLLKQQVEGVLLYDQNGDFIEELREQLHQKNIPTCTVNSDCPKGIWVASDDYSGVKMAVKHLVDLGHRRIAYMGGTPYSTFYFSRERRRGYHDALHEYLPGEKLQEFACRRTEEDLQAMSGRMLDAHLGEFTGIICETDFHAVSIIREAISRGIRIPDDLSVVGYAGLNFCKYAALPITTIAQPFEEIGRIATKRLFTAIENNEDSWSSPEDIKLTSELIVRQTTAPPRS